MSCTIALAHTLKLEGETENKCVCTKEWKGVTAEVLMATLITLPALIQWEVKVGGTGMKDVGGAVLAVMMFTTMMMMFITIDAVKAWGELTMMMTFIYR